MTEPAEFNPDETPSVVLAGKAWPIPKVLGWRALSRCRAELLDLTRRLNAAIKATAGSADETDDERQVRHTTAMDEVFNGLSNEDYDRLVVGPMLAALQALHRGLTRDEFEAWELTEFERQLAWLAVRGQSGLFVTGKGDPDPGEASGTSRIPS